ncbi:MAG: hypothetical protein R3B72_45155 [Polyangiaceae bacterium]
MTKHTSFEKHLIDMVRQMPAEALLELVKHELGVIGAAKASSAPRRARQTATSGKALTDVAVLEVVKASEGMALGEVAAAVGAEKLPTRNALKRLMKRGAMYMAGERRYARYATTSAMAKAASRRARRS